MERKYQRVGLGVGAFHNPPIAKYSEETRNLIKLLMDESKLTMLQRRKIQGIVDRGESLPRSADKMAKDKDKIENNQIKLTSSCRRRSQDMIINSGAYDREQYRRTASLPNLEKKKRHLACMMAYGKDMPETPHGPKILHKARREPQTTENVDYLNDLIQGIRDRMDFLHDMENLGLGKKYRPIMQQEIAEKMRLIETLDKQRSNDMQKEVQEFKYQRPSPKPFPLGDLDDGN